MDRVLDETVFIFLNINSYIDRLLNICDVGDLERTVALVRVSDELSLSSVLLKHTVIIWVKNKCLPVFVPVTAVTLIIY